MAPSNIVTYALMTADNAEENASPGSVEKFSQAAITGGEVTAISKPPITNAVNTAKIGNQTAEKDPRRIRSLCKKLRLSSAPFSGGCADVLSKRMPFPERVHCLSGFQFGFFSFRNAGHQQTKVFACSLRPRQYFHHFPSEHHCNAIC